MMLYRKMNGVGAFLRKSVHNLFKEIHLNRRFSEKLKRSFLHYGVHFNLSDMAINLIEVVQIWNIEN